MKNYVISLVIILMGINTGNAYAQSDNSKLSAQMKTDTTLNGTWYLLPVLPSDTATGKVAFLSFNLKKKQFSGNDGCNNISGTFVTADDKLAFDEKIKGTKMECKGYDEKAFLHNLLLTSNYKIQDGVLTLMNGTAILSKWTRQSFKNTPQKNIVIKN